VVGEGVRGSVGLRTLRPCCLRPYAWISRRKKGVGRWAREKERRQETCQQNWTGRAKIGRKARHRGKLVV